MGLRRRIVLALLVILVALAGVQAIAWQLHARHHLARKLPVAIRYTFIDAERRMHPYSSWPRQVNLVLSEGVEAGLASQPSFFRDALKPAHVEVQTERQALRNGVLSNSRCKGCVVVHYRELRNNPMCAEVEISFSGGDHASSYRQTWINVLGKWVHFRTQLAWVT